MPAIIARSIDDAKVRALNASPESSHPSTAVINAPRTDAEANIKICVSIIFYSPFSRLLY